MKALRPATLFVLLVATVAALAPGPSSAQGRTPAGASWIAIDHATGKVLAAHDPDRKLYPASLTKMLTAQVVLDHARPEDVLTIGPNAANAPADHMRWPLGRTFTVEHVLHAMMLMSSNGAAIALAEHVAGTVPNFSALMAFKARGLGITNSRFTTPEGLDAAGQLATARDLAVIGRNLLGYQLLAKIVRTRSYTMPWPGGKITLRNRSNFLTSYPGAIGIKPGFTTLAQNTLAAAAERKGRIVVVVVMKTPSPTADAAALLDAAFADGPPREERRPFKLFFALAEPAQQAAKALAVPFRPAGAAAVPLAIVVYLGSGALASLLVLRAARRRARG